MAWYDPKKPSLRQRLDSIKRTGLDVELELEDLDVELDDIFESLGDTFNELGDTFDSLLDAPEPPDYGGHSLDQLRGEYTGENRRARNLGRLKERVRKSRARGTVNIQSGGGKSNNISVSGSESVSISGSNGNLTMKIGNISEKHFVHKLKLTDHKNMNTTHIKYYDENNFTVHNDEFSGAFNIDDATIRNIKHYIRTDREQRSKAPEGPSNYIEGNRSPPPMPQMPPNTSFREHELSPDLDIMAPPFDTEGDPFDEYDKPHQSATPLSDPIFLSRTWRGEKGEPVELDENANVTVSGHSAFGRKYEVKINGNAIHVPTVENLMEFCFNGGDPNLRNAFVEMRSPTEKIILQKIFKGLIAMKIAEPHHVGINELL